MLYFWSMQHFLSTFEDSRAENSEASLTYIIHENGVAIIHQFDVFVIVSNFQQTRQWYIKPKRLSRNKNGGSAWFIFSHSWSKISKPNRRRTCKEHPKQAGSRCHTIRSPFEYPLWTRHLFLSVCNHWKNYGGCWTSPLLMDQGTNLLGFLCSISHCWIHLIAVPQRGTW